MAAEPEKNTASTESIERLKAAITELDNIIALEKDKATIAELETLKGELARVVNVLIQNHPKQ